MVSFSSLEHSIGDTVISGSIYSELLLTFIKQVTFLFLEVIIHLRHSTYFSLFILSKEHYAASCLNANYILNSLNEVGNQPSMICDKTTQVCPFLKLFCPFSLSKHFEQMICAVMLAYGARLSNNPYITGINPSSAQHNYALHPIKVTGCGINRERICQGFLFFLLLIFIQSLFHIFITPFSFYYRPF